MDIHRSLIKDFVMPKVKSVIVIDYYKGIQCMLESKGDFPYDNFLANPRMYPNRVLGNCPYVMMDYVMMES